MMLWRLFDDWSFCGFHNDNFLRNIYFHNYHQDIRYIQRFKMSKTEEELLYDLMVTRSLFNNASREIERLRGEIFAINQNKGTDITSVCKRFIRDHRISHPEQIYQTDKIIEDAYEFIEEICNIVGYVVENDE